MINFHSYILLIIKNMAEIPKWANQEINNKLSWLEYKSRPTLQDQIDTVEVFSNKLKTVRDMLDTQKKLITWRLVSTGFSAYDQRMYWCVNSLNTVTEIINELKESRAPVSKELINEFIWLEKYKNELQVYINKITVDQMLGNDIKK